MQKTIYVMPNPYCALDAKGMLAGGCQMAEERAGVAFPSNLKVGAELRVVEGSYNDRQAEISAAVDSGKMSSPVIPAVYSRDEKYWFFGAAEPVAIPVTAKTEGFYISRSRCNGTPPCLFLCAGPEDLPLEQLAEARLDAIAKFEAAYLGQKAPVDDWKSQFELDEVVADVMAAVAEKRKADADKADAYAKKAASDAEAANSKADDKRKAAREKAIANAKAKLAPTTAASAAKAKPDAEAAKKAETAEAAKSTSRSEK